MVRDFPGSIVVKTSLCSAGVVDSIRGWGANIPSGVAKTFKKPQALCICPGLEGICYDLKATEPV